MARKDRGYLAGVGDPLGFSVVTVLAGAVGSQDPFSYGFLGTQAEGVRGEEVSKDK